MSKDLWTAVDRYLNEALMGPDPVLDAALEANAAAGLPAIDVAPNQGKFLSLLAQIAGARRILEIGTLGGYSTIWLARALPPDGQLVTLELDPKHAEVALSNIARAGFSSLVQLRLGPALDSLAQLHAEHSAPFDLIFIDADKPGYADYLHAALKLSRPRHPHPRRQRRPRGHRSRPQQPPTPLPSEPATSSKLSPQNLASPLPESKP